MADAQKIKEDTIKETAIKETATKGTTTEETTIKETTAKEATVKETTTQTTGLPPATTKTPIMEFEISINKTSPATPGDKYLSTLMKLDKSKSKIAEDCQLWEERQLCRVLLLKLKNNVIVYEKGKIRKILYKWNRKEPITVINGFYDNDIVPYAGLVKPPLWHVKVRISTDGIPVISESQKHPDNTIPIRIDAFLSFDSGWYTISPYNKWPKDIQKKYTVKSIYQAISKDEKDIINELINNKIISQKRLTLDNIGEGEWWLPIYVCGGEDKGKKELLTYVKVIIKWTSEGAKATDKTGQQA